MRLLVCTKGRYRGDTREKKAASDFDPLFFFVIDIVPQYSVKKTVQMPGVRLEGPHAAVSGKGCTMSEFKGVTVVREANVYFEGKVTSRTVLFPDGAKKTLGVMLPGEFEFGTADKELMEIVSGELDVLLPGETAWKPIKGGQSFEVAANSKFKLKVKKLTDYCCSFIKG
jgi:uncharacterized protein YaiE (UPF0345 family)